MKINEVINGDCDTYINIRTGVVYQRFGPGSNIISYLEDAENSDEDEGSTRFWAGADEDVTKAAQALVRVWESSKRLRAEIPIDENSDGNQCPSCGHRSITLGIVEHKFEYGSSSHPMSFDKVEIEVTLPVFTCNKCKLSWLNECGAALKDYAVEKHLKTIKDVKPSQIRLTVPAGSLVIIVDEKTSEIIKGPALIDERIFGKR